MYYNYSNNGDYNNYDPGQSSYQTVISLNNVDESANSNNSNDINYATHGNMDYLINQTFFPDNFSGNGSMEMVFGPMRYKPQWILVPSIFAFIFLVGVLGNGLLIIIVAANRNMKTTPNVLLVSLAAGDLLLIVISTPFTSVFYMYEDWPFGETMCKLNEFLFTLSLGVSVFTLTALSGERYTVIVFPMKTRKGTKTMVKTVFMALLIWGASALLAVLDLVVAHLSYKDYGVDKLIICEVYPDHGEWYGKFHTLFRFLVYFLLPIVTIATFYTLIALILLRSSSNMPGEEEAKSRAFKQVEARKNVARIVLACVFIFILCWLPRHIYLFWFNYDPGSFSEFWYWFKFFGFCLSFMNSCVNPFALYFLSDQFRRHYNRYLFRWVCCCFAPLCKKSPFMTTGGYDDTVATTRSKSALELMSVKNRRASNYRNDTEQVGIASTATGKASVVAESAATDNDSSATCSKLKSRFVIFDGKRNSMARKGMRRSSNTANGKIIQKLIKSSKRGTKPEIRVDIDSKITGQSTI